MFLEPATEIAAAFAKLQQSISEAQLNPAQKVTAEMAVQNLRTEAQKGEQAEEAVVQSWFDMLITMAPDVAEVAAETFRNPIKGLSLVFQKVTQRARK